MLEVIQREQRLSINRFSGDKAVFPAYMSTGIFESKLISDLQSRIPSVVMYFWNLSGEIDKDRQFDLYM